MIICFVLQISQKPWPGKIKIPFFLLGDQQVCCNRMKPSTDKRPELSVCPKNEGKSCLSLNECADSAILTNSVSSSFLDIRESGLVDLDAKANLCPVDNQVCCTPQQGNLSRGIEKKNH